MIREFQNGVACSSDNKVLENSAEGLVFLNHPHGVMKHRRKPSVTSFLCTRVKSPASIFKDTLSGLLVA
jgi:hypothetical protein